LLFLEQGALWLRVKTSGVVAERSAGIAGGVWYAQPAVAVLFFVHTNLATGLYEFNRLHEFSIVSPKLTWLNVRSLHLALFH